MNYDQTGIKPKLLRATVWELTDGTCEHPIRSTATGEIGALVKCRLRAMELAHIFPRGMGHNGYRNSLSNVIAACRTHARTTDDLSDPIWDEIGLDRQGLADWVREVRISRGWQI